MMLPDKNTREFILKHESDDINKLALRSDSFSDIDMQQALQQIKGKQIAKHKIPSWYSHTDIIYPKHLSLEQCSSENTAQYKASLVIQNGTFIDLTGGMGVDFSFMSQSASRAIYLEEQKYLIELAKYNFEILGIPDFEVIESEAVNYLRTTDKKFDTIYLDPARRSESGKKTVFIEDCSPNLLEIDDLLDTKSTRTIIKLSPMLDISHALNSLRNISQVHIISVANECKELLLIKEKAGKEIAIHCINLTNNNIQESFTFTYEQEEASTANYTDNPQGYLYEPNSSIMKAGAYNSIATTFQLNKLHPNSHLYTSDNLIKYFPGRKFTIRKVISPNKKEIKLNLNHLEKANITTRNYPFSVAEIRKQTKLKDGGDNYIFATTLSNEKKVLILCEKLTD